MRTVLVGNRKLAKHVLQYLLDAGWNVVGAVSAAGDATRRQAGYVPFEDLADRHDLEVIPAADINSDATRARLEALEPDLCICPGWHQIIDETILDIPDRGFVGFHSSDLPRGRGGAPVNWAIIAGESEIALSLFYYSAGVDAGDVIHKEYVPIEDRDTVETVLERLATAARDALAATRRDFEADEIDAFPQSIEEATYRPRRQPQDGIIDWSRPAPELQDWIRAQSDPYPGAYTFADSGRVTVWSSRIATEAGDETPPGTVIKIVDGEGIDVATGRGILRLERVELDGLPRMWADEFARRRGMTVGDTFARDHAPPSWLYTGLRSDDGGVDVSGATNLRPGEQGTVVGVAESYGEERLTLRATFDGEPVLEREVVCDGRKTVRVQYGSETAGVHSLRLEFLHSGDRVDRRYLNVYVSP